MEGITHSICTIEFEDHRPLYDWVLDNLPVPCHPQQIEFARLNLSYTILSKRKLIQLVEAGAVSGWDDPRMPTISGLRRRGYYPRIRQKFLRPHRCCKNATAWWTWRFWSTASGKISTIGRPGSWRFCAPSAWSSRTILKRPPKRWKGSITPKMKIWGSRKLPFSRVLYIERDDFMIDPPKKYFRLAPGREVRLRYAYYIKCVNVVTDETTREIIEVHCTYDPKTRGGWSEDGRKVKGTLHWVSAAHAVKAQVRLYDRLFSVENPGNIKEAEEYKAALNPDSMTILDDCMLEPSLSGSSPGDSIPIRATRLFLRGQQREFPRPASVQPYCHTAGFLGKKIASG